VHAQIDPRNRDQRRDGHRHEQQRSARPLAPHRLGEQDQAEAIDHRREHRVSAGIGIPAGIGESFEDARPIPLEGGLEDGVHHLGRERGKDIALGTERPPEAPERVRREQRQGHLDQSVADEGEEKHHVGQPRPTQFAEPFHQRHVERQRPLQHHQRREHHEDGEQGDGGAREGLAGEHARI